MKIDLTFKTPDVLEDIKSDVERDLVIKLAKKFVRYDEYIKIELDTETGTARVVPLSEM